jgi:hypothetical protein
MKCTRDEFIEKAVLAHGNEYDYSLVNYIKNNGNVIIICKKHGQFSQLRSHHLNGSGCPKCASEKRTLTTENFIEKAIKIHGNKYNYSKVNYMKSNIPITIICPIHGEFLIKPENHLVGSSCPYCYNDGKLTTNEFINRSNIIHNFSYDYSKVDYKGYCIPITIICPEHGEFLQKPDGHLAGKGCQYCSGHKLNTKIFIEKAIKIHGDRYDYSKVNYIHNEIKLLIVCKIHGEFLQNSCEHLKGKGCPKCSMSKGENIIKKYLIKNKIDFVFQKMFNDCKYISTLRFDFYLPTHNILIEFDGIHHYKSFDYFGGEKTYNDTIIKDNIKNEYAKNNNIILHRLSYIDLDNNIMKNKLDKIFN